MALLGLAFTGGVVWVLDERMQGIESRWQETSRSLDARTLEVASLQLRSEAAEERQLDADRRLGKRFATEGSRIDEMVAELARLRRENTELTASIGSITGKLAAVEAKAGSGNFDLEKRLADLSSRLARSEDEARTLFDKIDVLETTPVLQASEPRAEPAPSAPAWHQHLPGLESDSASTRWEAVTALGATKDAETVPYIVTRLADADIFVRMAAARVLGDMQARSAIPPLIDTLEDGETAVREAANIALRSITGKDFKFDPLAVEAERSRRVKAWRDWWKKESESPSGM